MLGDGVLRGARRVLIYGVTGSGKTTLAERLSTVTSLPWYSVDDMTWEPGWVEVAHDEQRRRISAICARSEWILDTAYGRWCDIPLSRTELIVALDYPRWVSLQRLLRRTAARCWDQTPICNGNRESLRSAFGPDSIIRWHFRSFSRKRNRIRQWMDQDDGPPVIRLTSPRQANAWLARVAQAGAHRESGPVADHLFIEEGVHVAEAPRTHREARSGPGGFVHPARVTGIGNHPAREVPLGAPAPEPTPPQRSQ